MPERAPTVVANKITAKYIRNIIVYILL